MYEAQNSEGQSTPASPEKEHTTPRKMSGLAVLPALFPTIKNILATAITISSQFLQGLT